MRDICHSCKETTLKVVMPVFATVVLMGLADQCSAQIYRATAP